MSGFNTAYKSYRLARQRDGRRAILYSIAVSRLRRVLGEHAAATHARAIGPDILRAVFGD